MSGRNASWIAWSLWAFTVLAAACTLFLVSLNEISVFKNAAPTAALILAFSTVGALVASRRPRNAIGWLFCFGALAWVLGELTLEYAVYALITAPGALPAGAWATWFGGWARGMGWFLIVMFLLLLFPTGRLPSPRWRPVLWGAVGFVALFTLGTWLSPLSNDLRLTFVRNPLGLDIWIGSLLTEIVFLTFPLQTLAVGTAAISRFRNSAGDERQQLKWFAYAVGVMVTLFAIWFSLALGGLVTSDALMWTVPLLGLPAAVGVAILKHRLYDIDLVINRTLVYGSLTVALALVYVGGVVLLQRTFVSLTGGGSQLAVVASTLAIAALFNPLRRRVQAFVDRRFYRGKYDVAKTLGAFSARLRDETDLDALGDGLVGVVRETMRPRHASLWLRESATGEKPPADSERPTAVRGERT
jgi:hypothetical protein